ncbi:hypothetical protein EV182_002947 [Spiromyces aspiralis]|uniref:Uncharacterized protein n=1 Tax=Spiromyces aspiralis TaxID=68401 RepID=A0ACC1HTK9_9FUNG|nr:hypothetical protein EV182_002947 [Spiromyces aspiralis]
MGSQNYLITLMLLWYKDRHRDAVVVGAALFGVFVAMMTRSLVGMGLLSFLQALTIPIIVSSRIPQIYAIYKNKSTGQLSAFAVFNYLAGTLARVFTTLTEVDDDLVLAGAVLASIVNVVLAAQMIYYWNAGKSDLPVHSAQQRKGDRRGKQDRGKKFSPWSGQRHTNEGIDLKTK